MEKHRSSGFTLPEVMIASALATAIVASTLAAFINLRLSYRVQGWVNHLHSGLRFGMDSVVREARLAGYGVTVSPGEFEQWFTWGPAVTNVLHITPGVAEGDPDQLTIVGAIDPPVTRLGMGTFAGDITITVDPGTGSEFNSIDKKVIFIGRLEMARVVGVTGDQLTISKDPAAAGVGLDYEYPAGTPIELVKMVTYSCGSTATTDPALIYLMRDDHTSDYPNWVDRIVAVGIEHLEVSGTGNSVQLALTGRAQEEDDAYTHPTEGDGFRRSTLSSLVTLRGAPL